MLELLTSSLVSDRLGWDLTSICCRCHRLSSNTQCHGVQHFTQGLGSLKRKTDKAQSVTSSGKTGGDEKLGATFWNSLHSWIFPQSSLPPAVLSVISSAAARGGEAGRSHKAFNTALIYILLSTWYHIFFKFCCKNRSLDLITCLIFLMSYFILCWVSGLGRNAIPF